MYRLKTASSQNSHNAVFKHVTLCETITITAEPQTNVTSCTWPQVMQHLSGGQNFLLSVYCTRSITSSKPSTTTHRLSIVVLAVTWTFTVLIPSVTNSCLFPSYLMLSIHVSCFVLLIIHDLLSSIHSSLGLFFINYCLSLCFTTNTPIFLCSIIDVSWFVSLINFCLLLCFQSLDQSALQRSCSSNNPSWE
jgi:hypothetical protein